MAWFTFKNFPANFDKNTELLNLIDFAIFGEVWNIWMANARVLEFHKQIPHEKLVDPFFTSKFCPFYE